MNRDEMLERLAGTEEAWDVVIIGGGATGLGCAIESAARGYSTVLLEQYDFAKGTSSRSTKLVHGGVRYLQQGNISLVRDALTERGRMLRNAPHLCHQLPFIIPCYRWWEKPYYGTGLYLYDRLASGERLGRTELLSADEAKKRLPNVEFEGLRGGVQYIDGQFDDSRFAISMARTAANQGAVVLNYTPVIDLLKENGQISGVKARDEESGTEFTIRSQSVINATGVFAESILQLDGAVEETKISPSQGTHIVLPGKFISDSHGLMIPKTDDGRVLFAIPWRGKTLVGTTDTPVENPSAEPKPFTHELDFLLTHAGRYLTKKPHPDDVLSVFAGLRPLVTGGEGMSTAALSRDHHLSVSNSGLLTVTGGKWTTYRKMAEDAIDRAAEVGPLPEQPSLTADLRLHGYHPHPEKLGRFARYGSDAEALKTFLDKHEELNGDIHPKLDLKAGEVIWAAKHEMARTVEDVLARRTGWLFLNAKACSEAAEKVAHLLAAALDRDARWATEQTDLFRELAWRYQIEAYLAM